MSIVEAEVFIDSVPDLSEEHKIHLKTLLDRNVVFPNTILGRTLESLRGVVSRNPLPVSGIAQIPQYHLYSCLLFNGRTRKCFRANVFKIAEDNDAYVRQNHGVDGIFADGKNIRLSLFFEEKSMMNRFQSALLYQVASVSGTKRPLYEDNQNLENAGYNILVQHEAITNAPRPDVPLKRVMRYDYQHDGADDENNSPPCDTFSDANSLSIFSAEVVNIVEAETRVQMLENHTHDFFCGKNPEVAHIKDKALSTPSQKKDSNNRLYLSRFLHEHFDGINAVPTHTPSFKMHYVSHEVVKVDCPVIGDGAVVAFPHIKRHRTLVHVIFRDNEKRDLLQRYFRNGLRRIDDLTFELDLHFADADVAKVYLDWKEARTQSWWNNLDM